MLRSQKRFDRSAERNDVYTVILSNLAYWFREINMPKRITSGSPLHKDFFPETMNWDSYFNSFPPKFRTSGLSSKTRKSATISKITNNSINKQYCIEVVYWWLVELPVEMASVGWQFDTVGRLTGMLVLVLGSLTELALESDMYSIDPFIALGDHYRPKCQSIEDSDMKTSKAAFQSTPAIIVCSTGSDSSPETKVESTTTLRSTCDSCATKSANSPITTGGNINTPVHNFWPYLCIVLTILPKSFKPYLYLLFAHIRAQFSTIYVQSLDYGCT